MGNLPIELDKIDRALLNMLQCDNRLPAEILAERVGSSRSSVQRRLKRLRDIGAISADVSLLSPNVCPSRVFAIVEVKLETVRGAVLDKFKKQMLSLREVQQCYFVTGHVDFIVILSVENLQSYERITREYFAENEHVHRYHANIVADRVKANLNIPL